MSETVNDAAESPAFRNAVYPQAQEVRADLARLIGELDIEDATRLIANLNEDRDAAFDDIGRQNAYLAGAAVMIGIEQVCSTADATAGENEQ